MALYTSILLTVSVIVYSEANSSHTELPDVAWPANLPSPFRDFWRYFERRPKATLPETKPGKTRFDTELREKCGMVMYALSYPKTSDLDGYLMGFKLDDILLDIFYSKTQIDTLSFIHKIRVYSCDRLEVEYLVKGEMENESGVKVYAERCESTIYAREKMLVMMKRPPVLLEKLQWRVMAKAEDCIGWDKKKFIEEFKKKQDTYLPYGNIKLNVKPDVQGPANPEDAESYAEGTQTSN